MKNVVQLEDELVVLGRLEIVREAYFVGYILFGFFVLAKVWLVPGDDKRGVELEEVMVPFLDGPRE
jgi:hypothetical protein